MFQFWRGVICRRCVFSNDHYQEFYKQGRKGLLLLQLQSSKRIICAFGYLFTLQSYNWVSFACIAFLPCLSETLTVFYKQAKIRTIPPFCMMGTGVHKVFRSKRTIVDTLGMAVTLYAKLVLSHAQREADLLTIIYIIALLVLQISIEVSILFRLWIIRFFCSCPHYILLQWIKLKSKHNFMFEVV